MGTYMSAYIEVDYSDHLPPFTDPMQVQSLTEGSFTFHKGYDVFDAIAGGREAVLAPEDRDLGYPANFWTLAVGRAAESAPEDRDPARAPLFAPRGMPSPCSQSVGWDYFHLIVEDSDRPDRHFWPEQRFVSPEVAAKWVRDQGSHEAEFLQWYNCPSEGIVWRVVSAPEHYNASWLRLDEFDAALAFRGMELASLPVEYRIIRAGMQLLVEEQGLERVRLVLWFS